MSKSASIAIVSWWFCELPQRSLLASALLFLVASGRVASSRQSLGYARALPAVTAISEQRLVFGVAVLVGRRSLLHVPGNGLCGQSLPICSVQPYLCFVVVVPVLNGADAQFYWNLSCEYVPVRASFLGKIIQQPFHGHMFLAFFHWAIYNFLPFYYRSFRRGSFPASTLISSTLPLNGEVGCRSYYLPSVTNVCGSFAGINVNRMGSLRYFTRFLPVLIMDLVAWREHHS